MCDKSLSELIASGAATGELERAAIAGGMRPLRESALELVRTGTTTLVELERALGKVPQKSRAADATPQILVVDDDAVNRRLARALLEKNGFRVTEAEDGVVALQRLEGGETFALMILDLDMPKLGGRDVLARVRSHLAIAGLPIVVLTGTNNTEAEIRLMEEGADDYIRKPIDPPRFLARIKAALRRAGAGI